MASARKFPPHVSDAWCELYDWVTTLLATSSESPECLPWIRGNIRRIMAAIDAENAQYEKEMEEHAELHAD